MIYRRHALVWAACLAALAVGCRDCAGREETAAEEPDESNSGVEGDLVGGVVGGVSGWPGPEIQGSVIGQRDEADRYLSTVAVSAMSAPKGTYRLQCNGVLIASNLALTAAHCLCAPSHGETSRFDRSGCAVKAEVRVDFWDHSVDGGGIPGWEDRMAGDILIHPQFQIVLDSRGAVVTSRADLAIIRMERSVPAKTIEPVRLATEEVQAGEVVSVVGFGYDSGYISWRFRFFSREEVQTPAGEDRLLFDSLDRANYKGDTGGPCLRETKRGFELVGISQRGLGWPPAFTRIAPYREWLEDEIRAASRKP